MHLGIGLRVNVLYIIVFNTKMLVLFSTWLLFFVLKLHKDPTVIINVILTKV